jgi:NADPH-dependent curcumin reductase CurA
LNDKYSAEFDKVFPKLIKDGKIKYTEDITRGLENIGEAILAQQKGQNNGKSVVIVAEE